MTFLHYPQVIDIVLHCVDHGHLKTRPLSEVFPVLLRFSQVSHCSTTRRICVGSKNGNLTIYELRSNKSQQITAHPGSPITACAFSPDGKFLASYSSYENKMSFWQVTFYPKWLHTQLPVRAVHDFHACSLLSAIFFWDVWARPHPDTVYQDDKHSSLTWSNP